MLLKTNQFSNNNGLLSFIYNDKNDIVASCGVYKASFDPNVVIGGQRTYKLAQYRVLSNIGNYIMLEHFEWAKNVNGKVFILTFNEYNEKLMHYLHKSGKFASAACIGETINPRDFYTTMEILPFKILLRGKAQFVLYKHIDKDYQVKWPKIE